MTINEQNYAYGASKSSIREIAAYGSARKAQIGAENVFDFSLGNPSIPSPDAVRESIERSLQLPPTQLHSYTPAAGLTFVREKLAASLCRRYGEKHRCRRRPYLTCGAAASLSISFHAVVNPGDEVIRLPRTSLSTAWIETAGATCVEVMADPETFQIDTEAVRAAVTPRTKAVVINSPNNPVGSVYSAQNLLPGRRSCTSARTPLARSSTSWPTSPTVRFPTAWRCPGSGNLRPNAGVLLVLKRASRFPASALAGCWCRQPTRPRPPVLQSPVPAARWALSARPRALPARGCGLLRRAVGRRGLRATARRSPVASPSLVTTTSSRRVPSTCGSRPWSRRQRFFERAKLPSSFAARSVRQLWLHGLGAHWLLRELRDHRELDARVEEAGREATSKRRGGRVPNVGCAPAQLKLPGGKA